MSNELQKPVIGFTCGDLNGIGIELIIKTLSDHRLLDVVDRDVLAEDGPRVGVVLLDRCAGEADE